MGTTHLTTPAPATPADSGVETRSQLAFVGAYAASVVRGRLLDSGLPPDAVEEALMAMLEAPTPIHPDEVLIPLIIPEDPDWPAVGVWQFEPGRTANVAHIALLTGVTFVAASTTGVTVVVDSSIGRQLTVARSVAEQLAAPVDGLDERLASALDPRSWTPPAVPRGAELAAKRLLASRGAHQCGWWDPLLARFAGCRCHDD